MNEFDTVFVSGIVFALFFCITKPETDAYSFAAAHWLERVISFSLMDALDISSGINEWPNWVACAGMVSVLDNFSIHFSYPIDTIEWGKLGWIQKKIN